MCSIDYIAIRTRTGTRVRYRYTCTHHVFFYQVYNLQLACYVKHECMSKMLINTGTNSKESKDNLLAGIMPMYLYSCAVSICQY